MAAPLLRSTLGLVLAHEMGETASISVKKFLTPTLVDSCHGDDTRYVVALLTEYESARLMAGSQRPGLMGVEQPAQLVTYQGDFVYCRRLETLLCWESGNPADIVYAARAAALVVPFHRGAGGEFEAVVAAAVPAVSQLMGVRGPLFEDGCLVFRDLDKLAKVVGYRQQGQALAYSTCRSVSGPSRSMGVPENWDQMVRGSCHGTLTLIGDMPIVVRGPRGGPSLG